MALNDVPLTGQTLDDTRDAIRANFTTYINAQFAVDHQEFNSANAGIHNKLTMPQLSGAPAAYGANQMGLYVANLGLTAQSEMFVRKAPSDDIPFTAKDASYNQGWFYLPNGLLCKWMNVAQSSSSRHGTANYSFGPGFTTVYTVQITPNYIGTSANEDTLVLNVRTNNASYSTTSVSWVFNARPDTTNASSFNVNLFVIGV